MVVDDEIMAFVRRLWHEWPSQRCTFDANFNLTLVILAYARSYSTFCHHHEDDDDVGDYCDDSGDNDGDGGGVGGDYTLSFSPRV